MMKHKYTFAAFTVGPATTSLTVDGCVFEKNLALHGGGVLDD